MSIVFTQRRCLFAGDAVSLSAYHFMFFSHVDFMEVSKKDSVVSQRHIKLQEQTGSYNNAKIRDQI